MQPLTCNLQFQRQRATGPLPSLEAIQRPHPVPTVQLAAMTPALLSSTAEEAGRARAKATVLKSLPGSPPVEPGAGPPASLLWLLVGSEPLLITQLLATGAWALGKNSPRLSCGQRGRAATHRPGLRHPWSGLRWVLRGGGAGFIHAGPSARCALRPLGLSFPTCQLETLAYFSAVPSGQAPGEVGTRQTRPPLCSGSSLCPLPDHRLHISQAQSSPPPGSPP